MKLLESQWLEYRNMVLPSDAPAVQLTETRRAFYAGAWAYYMLMMTALDGGADDPTLIEVTDNDLALVTALRDEMIEFKQRVVKGLA